MIWTLEELKKSEDATIAVRLELLSPSFDEALRAKGMDRGTPCVNPYDEQRLWTPLYITKGRPPKTATVMSVNQLVRLVDDILVEIRREIREAEDPEEQAKISAERQILRDAKESLWAIRSKPNARLIAKKMEELLAQ